MARLHNRLMVKTIEAAKREGKYPDGNGLYLVVSETGAKSWSFCYTLNGRRRQMGIGSARAISLADARIKRDDCRKLLAAKIDPIEARKSDNAKAIIAAAKGVSFQQCAKAYIEDHKESWRNNKHIQQWENTLPTYAYPIIGDLPVSEIDVTLVMKVLEQKNKTFPDGKTFWKARTETANRVRGRIETILDWARVRGYRQGENPARWRGQLDQLLPKRSKIRPVKHHNALPYNKVGDFMTLLKQQPGIDAVALRFTILTGTRTNEVTKAKWEEINLKDKVWIIPASRMKANREHKVPLSEQAVAVLKETATYKKAVEEGTKKIGADLSGWVFAGRKKGTSLSNMAMLALRNRLGIKDVTIHGFRSTFRVWTAEQTRFSREVAEAALAHGLKDKTESAYQRSDLFPKRQQLMNDWAAYCSKPSPKPDTNNVFSLRGNLLKAS